MRVLRSVVEALMLSMLDAGHDLPLCLAVAGKLVGDHHTGRPHLPLQQLAQQPLGCLLLATASTSQRGSKPIGHAVWLYFRFPLGLPMVEELLAARGIIVVHETVRQW